MNKKLEALINNVDLDEAVFTVCSLNYLDKAVVMLDSVTDIVKKIIVIVDRKKEINCFLQDITIIFAEDFEIPRYDEATFKYNVIEMNTCIKPFVCKALLGFYKKVIYLDPDILVFKSLSAVLEELDEACFIITPHALSSPPDLLRPSDQDFLKFGLYNLGFFGASIGAVDSGLLDWWHSKLIEECFYEPSSGYGVDQKFVDLIPIYFENVKILRDKGLNVAFWNLHERNITEIDGRFYIDDNAILFVHFSSYGGDIVVAKKQTRFKQGERPDFLKLLTLYKIKIDNVDESVCLIKDENNNYSYDFFPNGAYVTPLARRIYYHNRECFSGLKTSFDDKVYNFLKNKGTVITGYESKAHINFNDISSSDIRIKILNITFKVLLRILGPIRYFALCRYFLYKSSTLNQADIFRD
jgi:hypothetical protein